MSYRPATDDDIELVARWRTDPEVSRYWDDEQPTVDEIRADFARPTVDPWIVLDDDEPVGYLQSWREVNEPRRGGLDGFLIPSARGRGVMPRAARALAQSLLDSGWHSVTVDPYEWNERAIRGWANAGFVEVSRGHPPDEDHTAEWVLMRFVGTDSETRRTGRPGYAARMKRLRAFLDRLPGGHRPPTGPLTTAEQSDADESRQEKLLDDQRIEREREERDLSSGKDD